MERDLWGNIHRRKKTFYVFHDESIPTKQWFLIGLSLVEEANLEQVKDTLRQTREEEDYWGEVHFSKLPKSFEGKYGATARVARDWMKLYEGGLAETLFFSCLAIDRGSPAYQHRRFTHDFHEYNRFTAMALKAAIAWHLGPMELDEVTVRFISDAKDRSSRPEKGIVDNFEDYLPFRVELDSFLSSQRRHNRYPQVQVTSLHLSDSSSEDLLQFTDLLLGATQMALVASSNRPVKREIGTFVVRWYLDTQQPSWEQKLGLHRKFNLWAFPDTNGRPFSELNLRLRLDDGQLSLFP